LVLGVYGAGFSVITNADGDVFASTYSNFELRLIQLSSSWRLPAAWGQL
jgi:hypothetical protein